MNSNKIIAGRLKEQQLMQQLLSGDQSEFLTVYGRRRVGKTFLIRNIYQKEIVFQMTGIPGVDTRQQLSNFFTALQSADTENSYEIMPADWFKAFEMLRIFLEKKVGKKKVVFFDELPWIDTLHSNFLVFSRQHPLRPQRSPAHNRSILPRSNFRSACRSRLPGQCCC